MHGCVICLTATHLLGAFERFGHDRGHADALEAAVDAAAAGHLPDYLKYDQATGG